MKHFPIGRSGWRRATMIACSAMALMAGPARADVLPVNVSNAGLFQLDGNMMDPDVPGLAPAIPGDDWSDLNLAGGAGLHYNAKSTFLTDLKKKEASVFTSGSKDTDDTSAWQWVKGSSPTKADLQHAYAAAYIDPVSGHLIVYFGADRAATQGTVSTGFWFFKNPITPNPDGTFNGHHAVGDTLVTVDYGGGVVNTVSVYIWDGSKLVAQTGVTNLTGQTGLFCQQPANGICAITNSGFIPSAWASNTNLKTGQFFEGGIDLTAATGGAVTCLSSFMAMSRSSTTTSSSTKNFIVGSFPVCDYTVTKNACETPLPATGGIQYTVSGTIRNTGFGPVNNISLSDSGVTVGGAQLSSGFGNPISFTGPAGCNGSLQNGQCSLNPGEQASFSGQVVFSEPVLDTIKASGTFPDVTDAGAGDRLSNAIQCPALPTGNLQVASDAAATYCTLSEEVRGGSVVLRVNVTATVQSTGMAPVSGVSVSDTGGSTFSPSSTTLAKAGDSGDTAVFTGHFYPTALGAAPSNGNADCMMFSDTLTARGTGVADSAPQTVSCGICPAGECPQSATYLCRQPN